MLSRAGAQTDHLFARVFETMRDLFSRIADIAAIASAALPPDKGNAIQSRAHNNVRIAVLTTELGRLKVEITFRAKPDAIAAGVQKISSAVGSFVISLEREDFANKTTS